MKDRYLIAQYVPRNANNPCCYVFGSLAIKPGEQIDSNKCYKSLKQAENAASKWNEKEYRYARFVVVNIKDIKPD